MKSASPTSLEPGLLSIFRLFIGVRLGLYVLAFLAQFFSARARLLRYPLLALLESALLLAYLSWPWVRERLGESFLPLALTLASVGPIVEHAISVALRLRVAESIVASDAWHLFPLLFVPLVLLSWQYNYTWVIFFCAGTAVLDLGLAIPLALMGGPRWITVFALVFVRTLLFALVGYIIVQLMTAQRTQRQALAEANARLVHYASTLEQLTISRERNRLAREMHDTMAHSLSAVAVQLEAVNSIWEGDPEAAREMLDQSLTTTRQGLQEARRAIRALRAAPLEDLGLALSIRNLAESTAARAGLLLDLRVPERVEGLGLELEQGIYRIAHEALANVARHAGATRLLVQLERAAGQLTLIVADDGQGFEPEGMPAEGHYGLQGMYEWAAAIGGRLSVESQPGRGTVVRLDVGE